MAVLAVAITLPSIHQGWIADDVIHRDLFLTSPMSTVFRDLFVFAHPTQNRAWMDLGTLPWWTEEALRIAFFRPVAVLTHWIDYSFWPDSIALMHAQSVLWYGAVCFAAAVVYRRLMDDRWVAGLAAFIFAVDSVHLGSVAWVANRNVLLAALFGLLCLRAHDRWRRARKGYERLFAPCWLAISLFSAEAGVATAAYLAAYALCLDKGTVRQRCLTLLPYVAVGVLWQLLYRYMGYGLWGSDFYMEPGSEPARFAVGVVERLPLLLLGQALGVIPIVYNLVSQATGRVIWLVATAGTVLAGTALLPLLRADRVARFWALGMLLAAVPACSIRLLSGRLLVFAGLGAAGLMAQFIAGVVGRSAWLPASPPWRLLARIACTILVAIHVVLPPIVVPIIAAIPSSLQSTIDGVIDIGPLPDAPQQDVIIVNAPSPFHFIYLPGLRHLRGEPLPAHVRVLAEGYGPVEVRREDDYTLAIRPERGYQVPPGTGVGDHEAPSLVHLAYMFQHLGAFFRSQSEPLRLHQRVALIGMTTEVTALADGRPSAVRVRFDRSLEDPSYKWLWWDWGTRTYREFRPPAVGQVGMVPGPNSASSFW